MDRFFSMYFFQLEEQGSKRERKKMARHAQKVGHFRVGTLQSPHIMPALRIIAPDSSGVNRVLLTVFRHFMVGLWRR